MAVLQAHQTNLEAQVRDLARTVQEGFASMGAKMDRLNEISLTIAQMSARQESHSDGLARAFGEIRALGERFDAGLAQIRQFERSIDTRFESQDQLRRQEREAHAAEHRQIDRRFTFAQGALWAMGAVGTLALGLLVWAASQYIDTIDRTAERVRSLEIQQATRGVRP